MIAFPSFKQASPANCLNLLIAFGIATLTILSLEYARRVHNGTLEHSDHIFSFSSKATEPSISQPSPSPSPTTPTQARYLPASALLTRPLATSLTTVPKYFHQSWLNTTLPAKFSHWSRTCREQHPDWEWVLWTDADNEELMRRYVPWVYADLDVECLAPTESLIGKYHQPGPQAFIGSMGYQDALGKASVQNAWFASTPGHPFWQLPLEHTQRHIKESPNPEALTGPAALMDVMKEYREVFEGGIALGMHYRKGGWRDLFWEGFEGEARVVQDVEVDRELRGESVNAKQSKHTVTVLPWYEVFPYSWMDEGRPVRDVCWARSPGFNETQCKLLLATDRWESHAITYWSHSWGDDKKGHDPYGMSVVMSEEEKKEVDDHDIEKIGQNRKAHHGQ
ncbi:hypothetical protein OEA41_008961 [Lepraria neglecta]|uniref:Glycosyltransferase family 32 protein n=1 Tax=Lepraria neglecta TaxID=209136 RepID=A0AAD9Z3C5_9LECA|nr:hypothetical protein OEA41_008961 [Lepraria neglecta]